MSHEQLALLERADRIPEGVVHFLRNVREQAFYRIRVAGVTAEPEEGALSFAAALRDTRGTHSSKARPVGAHLRRTPSALSQC